jgi:hypothetical protein
MKPRLLPLFLKVRAIASAPALGGLPVLGAEGNIVGAAALTAYLGAMQRGLSLANPSINASAVTNASTTALTLSAANCAQGLINAIVVTSGGSANTNTTDTATNIIALFWPGAYVGATALLTIANLNSGTMTLAGGTGVTITGTATTATLANTFWQAKVTNLANPSVVGAVATNTTTTSAAVSTTTGTGTAGVIPVASSTGMIANASYLTWVNTDGTTSQSQITSISSLNITVADPIAKPIASGAAVSVFNNAISFTRLYSCVTATLAA